MIQRIFFYLCKSAQSIPFFFKFVYAIPIHAIIFWNFYTKEIITFVAFTLSQCFLKAFNRHLFILYQISNFPRVCFESKNYFHNPFVSVCLRNAPFKMSGIFQVTQQLTVQESKAVYVPPAQGIIKHKYRLNCIFLVCKDIEVLSILEMLSDSPVLSRMSQCAFHCTRMSLCILSGLPNKLHKHHPFFH
jgi:hypothetical protein